MKRATCTECKIPYFKYFFVLLFPSASENVWEGPGQILNHKSTPTGSVLCLKHPLEVGLGIFGFVCRYPYEDMGNGLAFENLTSFVELFFNKL